MCRSPATDLFIPLSLERRSGFRIIRLTEAPLACVSQSGSSAVCCSASLPERRRRPLAATISGISIVKNAGNTADFFDDAGCVASVATQHGGHLRGHAHQLRRALRGGGGRRSRRLRRAPGTTTQSFTGNFSIAFSVTATAGNAWFLTLDVLRIGAQTIISDGSGKRVGRAGRSHRKRNRRRVDHQRQHEPRRADDALELRLAGHLAEHAVQPGGQRRDHGHRHRLACRA